MGLLEIEFTIKDTYKEYKKITQTISHWLASVGGITAIFLSGFHMIFGGMINFIWTVRFLSRESPPAGYSKSTMTKKPKPPPEKGKGDKKAMKSRTKDGKANAANTEKTLSFWETFKLYCHRSGL